MVPGRLWRGMLWGIPFTLAHAVVGQCGDTRDLMSPAADYGTVHQPVAEGRCESCHQGFGRVAGVRTTQICLDCHDEQDMSGLVKVKLEGHQALDCTDCHDPHYSDTIALLVAAPQELCTACHDRGYQGPQKHSHFADKCLLCHDPHAVASENYLRSSTVTLCQDNCHHSHRLGRSHPMGAGTFDKYAKSEITCTSSCHRIHYSNYATYLSAHPDKICYRCHAEVFFGKAGPFDGAVAGYDLP